MSNKTNNNVGWHFWDVKNNYQWLLLIIGAILLVISICFLKFNDTWWWFLCNRVGEIIIIGVLVGFLSSHKVIISGYRAELEKLLFDGKMLKRRNDIEILWENVSKELFKSKFPKIHSKLLLLIRDCYLPTKEISYYSNYDDTIEISWIDKSIGEILVEHTTEFTLYTDSPKAIPFEQSNWFKVAVEPKDLASCCDTLMMVDDNDCATVERSYDPEKQEVQTTLHSNLKGKTEYRILKKSKRRYNINIDYHIGFRAKYITDQMNVTLSHPDDMEHTFLERGTKIDFKHIRTHNLWKYQYKDLILPRQGCTIIIKPKD